MQQVLLLAREQGATGEGHFLEPEQPLTPAGASLQHWAALAALCTFPGVLSPLNCPFILHAPSANAAHAPLQQHMLHDMPCKSGSRAGGEWQLTHDHMTSFILVHRALAPHPHP